MALVLLAVSSVNSARTARQDRCRGSDQGLGRRTSADVARREGHAGRQIGLCLWRRGFERWAERPGGSWGNGCSDWLLPLDFVARRIKAGKP